MQKEYTVKEIKEMCGRARLIITSIGRETVTAINDRNGIQHIFKIKKLDPNEELAKSQNSKQVLIKEIKENIPPTREDVVVEKKMKQMANDEKERIKQSFEALQKGKKDEDQYVLPTDLHRFVSDDTGMNDEIDSFANEQQSIKKEPVNIMTKETNKKIVKEKKAYTGKPRGRKAGTKIDKATGKLIMAEDIQE